MKRTIKLFSLLLFMGVFFTACGDDDPAPTPDPEPEVESAFLQVYEVRDPNGSIAYATITADDFPTTMDIESSIELGSGAGVYVSGENFYVANASAQTITKWEVDRTTLEPSAVGVLSYASSGVNLFPILVFTSGTQAFVGDLFEGVIVEWNPEIMEITTVYDVEPVSPQGNEFFISTFIVNPLSNGKVAWSIVHRLGFGATCCDFPFEEDTPTLGVFDPATGVMEYKSDPRLPIGGSVQAQEEDFLYISPSPTLGLVANYFDYDGEDRDFLLRVDGQGNIDPSFEYNLSSVIDIDAFPTISTVLGDEIVITYDDIDAWPEAYEDRFNWRGNPDFSKSEVINLTTNEVRNFTAFDSYNRGARVVNRIDGVTYFRGNNLAPGGENFEVQGDFLRQDGIDEYTLITEGRPGVAINGAARLW